MSFRELSKAAEKEAGGGNTVRESSPTMYAAFHTESWITSRSLTERPEGATTEIGSGTVSGLTLTIHTIEREV